MAPLLAPVALLLAATPAQPPLAAPGAYSRDRYEPEPSVRQSPRRPASRTDGRPAPPTDDFTADGLAAFEDALTAYFGGTRSVPLAEKAAFYDWVIRRHHLERFPPTAAGEPVGIVHHSAFLTTPQMRGRVHWGNDTLTWNGALLSAMSLRYAVTRDPAALNWVRTLLGGIELSMTVTGSPGLPARCLMQLDEPYGKLKRRFDRPGAPTIFFLSDAAKGTVNQVACGLIVCQTVCGEALPPADRARAARLSLALADHLVRHDYMLTEADGSKTEFGKLLPRIGPQSIPFNAQVAYTIVAGGAGFGARHPGANRAAAGRVSRAFEELRGEHHVYYEGPGKLVRPERVGASPIVKGMNDRQHVMSAGYAALLMEWELARRAGTAADGKFLYEMGRTPLYAARGVRGNRNARVAFQWAGLLSDGRRAAAILPDDRERAEEFGWARAEVAAGVEHLRRFPLSRRLWPHEDAGSSSRAFAAEQTPWDCYVWKADPEAVKRRTGPPQNRWAAGIDFLHAYWLLRYWGLPVDSAG